MKQYCQ